MLVSFCKEGICPVKIVAKETPDINRNRRNEESGLLVSEGNLSAFSVYEKNRKKKTGKKNDQVRHELWNIPIQYSFIPGLCKGC